MGWIYWWAQAASWMPQVVNFVGRTPVLSNIVKWLGGISQHREMPQFASETFREWFHRRGSKNIGAPNVILWPDTFNNFFHPQIAKAAVEVLESAGFFVRIPERLLCCGRPLYDFGMLDTARRLLEQIMDALAHDIEAGVSIVGLEPSCVSVFRDELKNWFPENPQARRLREQTFLLSEFLNEKAPDFVWPIIRHKALVHLHCHHKSVLNKEAETKALKRMGLECEILDSGCCGMAGSFGFEEDHYDVSVACGERVLLPAVRNAAPETLLITDGFSCHEQIAQCTGRRALHLAEVIQKGLREEHRLSTEDRNDADGSHRDAMHFGTAALLGGAVMGGALALWLIRSRRKR